MPKTWEPKFYNQWAGYKWTYEEARCAYVSAHGQKWLKYFLQEVAFKVISNSNKDQYLYLMDWVAYAYQFPWIKLAAIIIMYSAKTRCGKNFFANACFKGYGRAFQLLADKKKINARFNSHLARLMVQLVDEIDFSRDTELMEYLKSMTTEERMQMEEKGKETDEYIVTTRLMCTTNNRNYMKCNLGSMRFAGYELSTHQSCKVAEFWGPLDDELSATVDGMTEVGYKAIFFYFMYDHVISDEFKRSRGENVPVSSLQKEQEAASMSSVMSFIEKIIDDQEHINPFALADTLPENDSRFTSKDHSLGDLMAGRRQVQLMHKRTDTNDLRREANDNALGFEVEEVEGKNWVTVVDRKDLHDLYKKFYHDNPEQRNKKDFKELSPFMGVVGEVFGRTYTGDSGKYVLDRKNIKVHVWPMNEVERAIAMTKEGFDGRARLATNTRARARYIVLPEFTEARRCLQRALGNEVEEEDKENQNENANHKKFTRGLRVSIDDKVEWSLDLIKKKSRPCRLFKTNSEGRKIYRQGVPISWISVDGFRTATESCFYYINKIEFPGKNQVIERRNVVAYTYTTEELNNLDIMMDGPVAVVEPESTPEHLRPVDLPIEEAEESQPRVEDSASVSGSPVDVVMSEDNDEMEISQHSAHSVAKPKPKPRVRQYADGMVEKDEESDVEVDEEEELRGQGGAEDLDSEDSERSADDKEYAKGDWRSKLDKEDLEGYATPESVEEKHSFEELLSHESEEEESSEN